MDSSTIAQLGLTVIAISLLLRRSRRYFARQPRRAEHLVKTGSRSASRQGETACSPGNPSRLPLDAPVDVLQWQVDMHETARDLSGKVDSKMRLLQQFIAEANRAASRLEQAVLEADREVQRPES